MLSEMIQQVNTGEPTLFVSYRRAVKLGEDYTTVELGVMLPAGATDETISRALATGDQVYQALHDEVEARIAQAMEAASAPTETQLRSIRQMLEKLGVPANDHDEAMGLLGGCPATRRQAQGRLKRLATLQRNGHKAGHPKGWRWARPQVERRSRGGKQAAQGREVTAALAFELPWGPQSHPEWKGQKLGDIAALPEGPRFLAFLKDAFKPTTPEGEKLKAHAATLANAGQIASAGPESEHAGHEGPEEKPVGLEGGEEKQAGPGDGKKKPTCPENGEEHPVIAGNGEGGQAKPEAPEERARDAAAE